MFTRYNTTPVQQEKAVRHLTEKSGDNNLNRQKTRFKLGWQLGRGSCPFQRVPSEKLLLSGELAFQVLLEALFDVIQHRPARKHGHVCLECDSGLHVAESEAFLPGGRPVDLLFDAALSVIVAVCGALHQVQTVMLRARIGSEEHSRQRLLR